MDPALWSRTVVAIREMKDAERRVAEGTEKWEQAKAERERCVEAHQQAEDEAASKFPDELPTKEWRKLQGVYAERVQAEEAFDLADRRRRSLLDLAKKLAARIMEINLEAYGDGKLPYQAPKDGRPAWHHVQLTDFMGELIGGIFTDNGIRTLADAKAALEQGKVKTLVRDGDLTQKRADYLHQKTVQRLNDLGVQHDLGKPAVREIHLTDVLDKPKEDKPAGKPAGSSPSAGTSADAATPHGKLPSEPPKGDAKSGMAGKIGPTSVPLPGKPGRARA